MKAVVQRVSGASVSVEGSETGAIDRGLLVYLGVGKDDVEADARWLAEKIASLRIFEDGAGKMNLSALELSYGALVISQFTLFADARKGRRPSYDGAAAPALAIPLYELFKAEIGGYLPRVASGVFGADMAVRYTNDGPVTIILDTKER